MPPLDHCYNTEPGCYAGPVTPSVGETMSYCHLVQTVEMGFGSVVAPVLRTGAEGAACFGAAPGVCGDGVLAPGEHCDDGNNVNGDCCAANCVAEAGQACASDGDPCTSDVCNDAAVCTHVPPGSCTPCSAATVIPAAGGTFPGTTSGSSQMNATCGGSAAPEQVFQWTPAVSGLARLSLCGSGYDTVLYVRSGLCETGPQVACNDDSSPCGQASTVETYVEAGTTYFVVVDGFASLAGSFTLSVSPPGCAAAPVGGCKLSTAPAKGKLQLKNAADDAKDQLSWTWGSGAATSMTELGNPTGPNGYQMCIYDFGGLVSSAAVPPGGTCDGKPCWSGKPTSFAYKNKARTPNGIEKMQLKSSATPGKAKIAVKGKGGLLAMPNLLAITPPVRVQLVRPSGPCWEASFSAPIIKPDGSQLTGKSD
ncbi:MAG: hypothetical protein IT293_14890 [Deltaproteobacteria bacterium]|nr:hypothetical protein [Deltaproteobacteria bacterium]